MGHNDNSIIKHVFNCESLSTGICYVRDYESISHLCEYYNTYFDSMLINKDVFPCEMNATFRYFKKYPERVETLPVIWKTNNLPNYYYNKLDTYQSIFDGASLGVLLFGHDTYHTNGKIILGERVKGTNMDFRSCNFKWEYDEQWRKIPYIYRKDTDEWYKINNLHIHSKNLKASLSKIY